MAYTEKTEYKVEIVPPWSHAQIRKTTITLKDDKEVGRQHARVTRSCDASISDQTAYVQGICNAAWTDDVKKAYSDHLKTLPGG